VAERARAGDPEVMRALDEVAEFVGIGIAGAVSLVNPRRVVLAGTLGTLSPWLLAGARASVAQRTRLAPTVVEIVGSQLGDEAAIRGGAAFVLHGVLHDPTCVPAGALAH
jgi:predicted NBD/HSP70 family sugar kinase